MGLSYFSDRILRSTNGKFDEFVCLPENRQSLGQAAFLSEDVRWARMFRNASTWGDKLRRSPRKEAPVGAST